MSAENQPKKDWKKKLKEHYRLVVMNNDTFREVGSYRLNLLSLYILISSLIVAFTLLVFTLIVYTPLKRYIPGYGDYAQISKLNALQDKVNKLETELDDQSVYTSNIKKIMTGDIETERDIEDKSSNQPVVAPKAISRIPEDEQLRKQMVMGFSNQNNGAKSNKNYLPINLPLESIPFASPVKGIVTSQFELNLQHYGIDIAAPSNTPITAILNGHVIIADWTLETGFTIGIQHDHDIISFYKHNNALLKKVGDSIKTGEAIAIIGNTGTHTTGPHLHFEIWSQGRAVDPSKFVKF